MHLKNNKYTRNDISRLFNIGKETLRYYEKINLISAPARDENGYRVYFKEDLLKIEFIIRMKRYGFTLKEISDLIQMVSSDKFADIDKLTDFIDDKVDIIKKQIDELNKLVITLNNVKENDNLGECGFLKSLKFKS